MIIIIIINNLLISRKIKQWLQRRKIKSSDEAKQSWETDYEELIDFPGLFDEYLEMGSCYS